MESEQQEQEQDDLQVEEPVESTSVNLVTDKRIYVDLNLQNIIKVCIRRNRRKWDNLIVIDGDERSGKSTLAKTIGYYYQWQRKYKKDPFEPLTIDNIFFDLDELIEYAIKERNKVIIWDESALGGLGSQWQSKVQVKLMQLLMIAGKYGHFFIFIIPSFFKLQWYLAVHRSLFLIHVYSRDFVNRGDFSIFNKKQKTWIYNNNRKSNMYSNPTFNAQFRFARTDTILDESLYEKKKDEAILKYLKTPLTQSKTGKSPRKSTENEDCEGEPFSPIVTLDTKDEVRH